MKVILDLSKLVEEGKITAAEAERLKALSAQEAGSIAINILVGFGVTAVAAGAVALVPSPLTGIVLGLVVFAAGLLIAFQHLQQWNMLGQICLIVGAQMFGGGVVVLGQGSLNALLIVTAAFAAGALVARSSLLMALAVLALSACLGARTGYSHAMYSLAIFEPTLTVLLFSAVAYVSYEVSKRVAADFERLAITAARTSLLLVNFGFWIGSLWGDRLMLLSSFGLSNPSPVRGEATIPAMVFIVGWAVVLFAVGAWAASVNRRWVVNLAAVFGAIHFYTQWFERLGASAGTVLAGGVVLLVLAYGFWRFNQRQSTPV